MIDTIHILKHVFISFENLQILLMFRYFLFVAACFAKAKQQLQNAKLQKVQLRSSMTTVCEVIVWLVHVVWKWLGPLLDPTTVDGRNPAPPAMVKTL